MSQIIKKVLDVDPNSSEAVKDVLVTFFKNLTRNTGDDCMLWLNTLENVISRFPKYCMTHRNTIESYLSNFLDSSYYIVIHSAKCAHILQQVRPLQEKAATSKSCWRNQMSWLCSSAQKLLSSLFTSSIIVYNEEDAEVDVSLLTPLSRALSEITTLTDAKDIDKTSTLCIRLRNVFVFMQAMLVEIYPVAKPVRPQTILDVIVRTLSVTSSTQSNVSQENITMVKIQALKTLDALIVCLGVNLIPYSPLVFRFVMQTLRWCSDNPSEHSSKVRISAYNTLSKWLTTLRCHNTKPEARVKCWTDELTSHIINDITPVLHVVKLTLSSQSTKNLSKKAKRKLANSQLMDSTLSTHMPGAANKNKGLEKDDDDVAIAALECAETFLLVCGMFLKPSIHKQIADRLVSEISRPSASGWKTGRLLMSLRALHASRQAPPPSVGHHCLALFALFVNHEDVSISKFCSEALLDMRLQLHGPPPSLIFAAEVQEKKDDGKAISERNRAALESLLGADRLPPTIDTEILTISDDPKEPDAKRRRQISDEEILDNISISSRSDSSVEILEDQAIYNNFDKNHVERDKEEMSETNKLSEQIKTNEPTKDESDLKHVDENNINTAITQISNIHQIRTQIPLNVSHDTLDGDEDEESPEDLQVSYDFPSNGDNDKVTVIDKMDYENLPSTNDTDDCQIACGQMPNSSQDLNSEKEKDEIITNGTIDTKENQEVICKVNGIDTIIDETHNKENIDQKVNGKNSNECVSVEEMLADFVDEVADEVQVN